MNLDLMKFLFPYALMAVHFLNHKFFFLNLLFLKLARKDSIFLILQILVPNIKIVCPFVSAQIPIFIYIISP